MNLEQELERATQPPMKKSEVKHLTRQEILRLQLKGEIAPVSRIPQQHLAPLEYAGFRMGRSGSSFTRGKLRWRR